MMFVSVNQINFYFMPIFSDFWKYFILDDIYFWCIRSVWAKGFETFSTSNLSKTNVSWQFRLLRLIKVYVSTFFILFSFTENCPLKTVHSINCVGFRIDASEVINWPSIWKSFLGTAPKKYFNRGTSRLIFRHCPECVFRAHKLREWCKGRSTHVSELLFYHL